MWGGKAARRRRHDLECGACWDEQSNPRGCFVLCASPAWRQGRAGGGRGRGHTRGQRALLADCATTTCPLRSAAAAAVQGLRAYVHATQAGRLDQNTQGREPPHQLRGSTLSPWCVAQDLGRTAPAATPFSLRLALCALARCPRVLAEKGGHTTTTKKKEGGHHRPTAALALALACAHPWRPRHAKTRVWCRALVLTLHLRACATPRRATCQREQPTRTSVEVSLDLSGGNTLGLKLKKTGPAGGASVKSLDAGGQAERTGKFFGAFLAQIAHAMPRLRRPGVGLGGHAPPPNNSNTLAF